MTRKRIRGCDSPLSGWIRKQGGVLPSTKYGLFDVDILWVWHDHHGSKAIREGLPVHKILVIEEKSRSAAIRSSTDESMLLFNGFLMDTSFLDCKTRLIEDIQQITEPRVKTLKNMHGETIVAEMYGMHTLSYEGEDVSGNEFVDWNYKEKLRPEMFLGILEFKINPWTLEPND
jgi:hypothetical protein